MSNLLLNASLIGYLAGILDGEGHLRLSKHQLAGRPYFRARITVTNTSLHLCEWLKGQLGGSIGTIEEGRYNPNAKAIYCWRLTGQRLTPILRACQPLMLVKRRQADLLLCLLELQAHLPKDAHIPNLKYSEQTVTAMQHALEAINSLNRKGNGKNGAKR